MRHFVPAFILERFACREYTGELPSIVLGLDISSFTTLAENLTLYRQRGAETLSNLLEAVFQPTIECVYANGGMVASFAGDALIALFPTANDDAAVRAWQTAVFIQTLFLPENQRFTAPYGAVSLQVKIGLSLGAVEWGIPGAADKYTFYFRGAAIQACAAAQKLSTDGQIVVDGGAARALDGVAAFTQANAAYQIARPRLDPSPRRQVVRRQPVALSRSLLRSFVADSILEMIQPAEFRHVCPLFINFQTPPKTDRWHAFVADLIDTAARYGGVFSQLDFSDKGNLAVIWFGAPVGHEDDARRAADYLLDLQRQHHDIPWRAGISFGLAWAGIRGTDLRCEYSVIGHVVNTAARLAFKADWGEIWLDQSAARYLRTHYQLQDRGIHPLRGQKTPHRLYTLLCGGALTIMYRGKLLGRDGELERLNEALRPLLENRFGGVVYLYGQAGMGKSRLAFEWRRQLGERVNWLYCPAQDHIAQSLSPFRHYLRVACGQLPTQSQEENQIAFDQTLGRLLERLQTVDDPRAAALGREMQRTKPFLAALLTLFDDRAYLNPKLHFENTIQALIAYLQARALLQPTVIQIEDFHWCDQDTAQFLERFLLESAGYPLLTLCTSRYGQDGAPPLLQVDSAMPQTAVHLDRLAPKSLRGLARALLGKSVHRDVSDLLIEKSGGIPFYAEQLTLALQDQRLLEERNGRYYLMPQTAVHLPASLNALLITRLDRLPAKVKQVVQTASVLGEQFTAPILSAILPEAEVEPCLLQAQSMQICDQIGENRYLFRHVLLREAAYQMQLQSQRRKLHETAVVAYETIYADTVATYYHELAYHAHQAGNLEKELTYSLQVGLKAAQEYANDEALTYLKRVVALGETVNNISARRDALEGIGRILHRQGHYVETAVIYEQLHALTIGDAVAEAEAILLWAGALEAQGKNTESLTMVQAAATRLQGTAAAKEQRAQALYQEAWLYFRMSNDEEALSHADACLELLDMGQPSVLLIQTLKLKGYVYLFEGQYNLARHWLQKGWDAGKAPEYERELSTILNALGEVARLQGDYEAALSIYHQALDLAEKLGMHSDYLLFLSNLGGAQVGAGLVDEAIETLEQVRREMNPTWFNIPETYRFLAEAYLQTGRRFEALEIAQAALALAITGSSPNMQGGSWLVLGQIAAAGNEAIPVDGSGALYDAADCFGRSLEIYETAEMARDVAWTLRLWAQHDFSCGDLAAGGRRWQRACQLFEQLEMDLQLQQMERV